MAQKANRLELIKQHSRRPVVLSLVVLMTSLLSACGFHLRQDYAFTNLFHEINLECANDSWRLCQQLRNQFEVQGVKLNDDAPLTLKIHPTKTKNRALTITSDASVDEYELSYQTRYQLISAKSDIVINDNTVKASRRYQHDNKALLPQERNIEEMQISLQRQIANSILSQLSALNSEMVHLATQPNGNS